MEHITVISEKEAWSKASELMPTDFYHDSRKSNNAGYPIYFSTSDNVNAWISDLGNRLEVNLPDGSSINVWIDEPEYKEYQLDDMLNVVSDMIYELEDKILPELASAAGFGNVRKDLYKAYEFCRDYCNKYYPESKLIKKYNLNKE